MAPDVIEIAETADHAQDLRSAAMGYERGAPSESDTDNAAYFSGIARRRLYGIEGEEAGNPQNAYRLLQMAKHELKTAMRYLEQAEDRFWEEYGIGEGMMSPAEQAESDRQVQIIRAQCQDGAKARHAAFAQTVVGALA